MVTPLPSARSSKPFRSHSPTVTGFQSEKLKYSGYSFNNPACALVSRSFNRFPLKRRSSLSVEKHPDLISEGLPYHVRHMSYTTLDGALAGLCYTHSLPSVTIS